VITNSLQFQAHFYADDLVLTTENEEILKQSAKELIKIGAEIGLSVNEEKTKYLILSRKHHTASNL